MSTTTDSIHNKKTSPAIYAWRSYMLISANAMVVGKSNLLIYLSSIIWRRMLLSPYDTLQTWLQRLHVDIDP